MSVIKVASMTVPGDYTICTVSKYGKILMEKDNYKTFVRYCDFSFIRSMDFFLLHLPQIRKVYVVHNEYVNGVL